MSRLHSPVESEKVTELQSWASIWADLLQVDMTLMEREQLPDDPAHLFARRSLWEGAAVAYGRTMKQGRRQVLLRPLEAALPAGQQEALKTVMHWRDKHVAHRVDASLESVTVTMTFSADRASCLHTALRIAPAVAPSDSTVSAFGEAIKALRDAVWQERMAPLDAEIVAELEPQLTELAKGADVLPRSSSRFVIDINVCG